MQAAHKLLRVTGVVLGGLLLSAPAAAYRLGATAIHHDAGVYIIAFDVHLDADAGRVRELMTDYDHLDRLSNTVISSQILEVLADGSRHIKLDMRACVLFLCKTVRRVQKVTTLANGDITTSAIPELSDFTRAHEHWRIQGQQDGTRIHYRAELVPSFFVPPWLGPYLIKQAIRRELITAAERLESLAGTKMPASASIPASIP